MKKKSFNDDKSPNYLLLSCKRVLLLFYLLFSTLVSAQIYIIGDTKIFISESTTISAPISQVKEHTSEKAKIYITKGTVIKSLEQQSSNIQIAYIPSHFPQKKQVKNKSLFVKTELPKEAKEKKKHTPKITLLFTPQKPADTFFATEKNYAVTTTTTERNYKLTTIITDTPVVQDFRFCLTGKVTQYVTFFLHNYLKSSFKIRSPPINI